MLDRAGGRFLPPLCVAQKKARKARRRPFPAASLRGAKEGARSAPVAVSGRLFAWRKRRRAKRAGGRFRPPLCVARKKAREARRRPFPAAALRGAKEGAQSAPTASNAGEHLFYALGA